MKEDHNMKKYFYFAAALLFAAISCTKETPDTTAERPVSPEQSGRKTIVLNIAGPDTKTYVSDPDHGIISWETDDVVGVFTDKDVTEPLPFTLSSKSGASATFTGEVSDGASHIYVFYPYSADATFADGKITMTLPSEQSVGANNVAKGAMVTVGEATKGGDGSYSARLHNAFSYIKFKITGDDVKEIVLSGGSDKLAGTATFSVADDGTMIGTGTESSIRATKADGYFTKDTYYYIPVLPGKVAALSFSMTSNTHGTAGFDDWKAERVAGSALTFTRGTGLKFDKLDQGSWSWYFDIHDAASLERFRALVAAGTFPAAGVAKFTSDIDLSGKTLTAAAGTFSGTLDGQGHSITNWNNGGTPLIRINAGIIKELNINQSCSITMVLGRHGVLTDTNNSGGTISNCKNYADVEWNGPISEQIIFGFFSSINYGKVEECRNYGNIIVNATDITGNQYFGGLVGYFNTGNKTAFKQCGNEGNIQINATGSVNSGVFNIGGIVAGTSVDEPASAGNKGTIESCYNSGKISYTFHSTTKEKYCCIGGVAAYVEGHIKECHNTGEVSLICDVRDDTYSNQGTTVGGVVGWVNQGIENSWNEGTVKIIGTFGNGTVAKGCGNSVYPSFGGVVGKAGPVTATTDYQIEGCYNNGMLKVESSMGSTHSSNSNIGGIVGTSLIPVVSSYSTENSKIEVKSKSSTIAIGGICGWSESNFRNDTNNGTIVLKNWLTEANGNQGMTLALGGVLGLWGPNTATDNAGTMDGCNNNGSITNEAYSPGNAHIGGIIGRSCGHPTITKCKNQGELFNSGTIAGTDYGIMMGGIAGRMHGANAITGENAVDGNFNNGRIKNQSNSPYVALGGIVGHNSGGAGSLKYCTNGENGIVESESSGTITEVRIGGILGSRHQPTVLENNTNLANITNDSKGVIRVGGILGYTNSVGNVANCINGEKNTQKAKISSLNGTGDNFAGGIYGYTAGALTSTDCNNYGDVAIYYPSTVTGNGRYSASGIGGYANSDNSHFTRCENYGAISIKGNVKSNVTNSISGIGASADKTHSFIDCKNYGDLENDSSVTMRIGGIGAYITTGGEVRGNYSECNIISSSTAVVTIGGIIGYSARTSYVNNSFKGSITASSTKDSHIGGILGQEGNGSPTFSGGRVDLEATVGNKEHLGIIAGDSNTTSKTFTIGTESSPIVIGSNTKINGSLVTELTATNLVSTFNSPTVIYTDSTVYLE